MRLHLSREAERDIDEIARYTEQRWGKPARQRYLRQITERLKALLANPELGPVRDDIRPGNRSLTAGRHIVFYRLAPDAVEIIRILHHAMDVQRRIEPAEEEEKP